MIHIGRPIVPAVLITRGTTATQNHCAEYDAAPDEYRRGVRYFRSDDFDGNIYAADEVKTALLADQNEKCAFCESFVTHISYGTVEHYRPKAGYRLRRGEPLRRPGYYWLAYDWDNLFFCCQLCNEQFKGNLFPLRDNRSRTRSHMELLSKEAPLLVNPATQEPAHFIGFNRHVAEAINNSREGTETIDVLGLNRDRLLERRRKHIEDLECLVELCAILSSEVKSNPGRLPDLQLYQSRLEAKRQDTAEYTAMARAFLGP